MGKWFHPEGMKLSIFFKILGKRGWLGVILFIVGFGTFVSARGAAKELVKSTWEDSGSDVVTANEAVASVAGYNSWEDYLTERNKKSGVFFMVVGMGLACWGLKKYGEKVFVGMARPNTQGAIPSKANSLSADETASKPNVETEIEPPREP